MNYHWVELDGVWSQYATLDKNRPNGVDKALIIVPGNPGLPRFYEDFALALAPSWPEHAIFVLSNLGGVGGAPQQAPNAYQDKRRFMLEGQIEHKRQLIELLAPNAEITLIGHSIGAYMALHLIDSLKNCSKVVGITPTIERMEQSPEGKRMTFHFSNLTPLYTAIFFIISLFPRSIRDLIVKLRGSYVPCVHKCIRDEFLTSNAIWTAFFMAESEMAQVVERPDALLSRHSDKISLYYARDDRWTPREYFESLQKSHPSVKCHLLPAQIPHAFVEQHSAETVQFVEANEY